jgi:hypothetical protein
VRELVRDAAQTIPHDVATLAGLPRARDAVRLARAMSRELAGTPMAA